LAIIRTDEVDSNSPISIIELDTSTAAQSPTNIIAIDATGANALRMSGSATSTGYLSRTDDRSLLTFNAANSTDTTSNVNTLNPRAVGSLNQAGTFTIQTTYTGSSGQQTRSSTSLNNTNWFIADQAGLYTNGATAASPTANLRGIKSFGGTVYVGQQSSVATNIQVSTVSAPSSATITGLTGLVNSTTFQDFYLIQSGDNGTTYDVLYTTSATGATAGTIAKFSLVSGTWVANGTYTTDFGGFGLAAADNGTGALLFASSGTGATVANRVIRLADTAGFNASINIVTANNVTLYTSPASTTIKGVDFVPVAPPLTTAYANPAWAALSNGTAITDADPVTAGNQPATVGTDAFGTITAALGAITSTGTVLVNSGSYAESVTVGAAQTIRLLGTDASTAGTVTINSIAGAGTIDTSSIGSLANSLVVGDATSTTFAGVISGTGSLTKQGAGTFTLSGTNTYSGSTTSTAGILSIASDANLGTAPGSATPGHLVLNGGTLQTTAGFTLNSNRGIALGAPTGSASGTIEVDASTTLTYAGIIADNGTGADNLIKTGAGTLTLSGANTYSGTTTINAGTLQAGAASTLPSATAVTLANTAGAILDLNNFNQTIGSLAGGGTTGGNVTLGSAVLTTGDANNTTFAGVISGTGSLTKQGPGTFTLSAANTYTGGTTHSAGIINIGDAAALGTGTFTFNGYNRLQIAVPDGTSWTVANNFVLPATGAGGENELIRVGDGSPTAGTTARLTGVISGGTAGQTYTLVDSDQSGNHNNVLILDNAANTFAGTVEIWRGTLAFTSDGALGNVNNPLRVNAGAGNGGLRFDADNITLAATRTINLLGSEVINTQAFNATIASSITGAGLRKTGSGTLTLTGSATNTGTTNVNSGTLRAGAANVFSASSAFTLDNTAGVTLDLNNFNQTIGSLAGGGTTGGNVSLGSATLTSGGNNTSTTFSGVISGSGSLTKAGTGTFTLANSNTYTGGTTLNAGSLTINVGAGLGTGTLTVNLAASGTFLTVANNAATTVANNIVLPTPGSAQTFNLIKNTASATTGTELNLTGIISGGNANTTLFLNTNTSGDSTTTYRFGGNNTFRATINLNRGAIVVGNLGGLGDAANQVTLDSNPNTTLGNLRFEVAGTYANPIQLTFAAGINPNANTVVLSGNLAGSAAWQAIGTAGGGTGTLVLAGVNNTNSGSITIQPGATLQVGNAGTSGSLGTANVTNNGALIFNRTNALSVSNVISGSGTLTQSGAGTLTLSATNTYTGATTITGGTLSISGDANLGTAPASATPGHLVINGGTLQVTVGVTLSSDRGIVLGSSAGSASGTIDTPFGGGLLYGGIIADNGTGADNLIKSGLGTLALTGANTYTGTTTVIGGTFRVDGSITSVVTVQTGATLIGTGTVGATTIDAGATLAPGGVGIGTLTVNGTLNVTGNLDFEFETGSNDQINVSGNVTLTNPTFTPSGTFTSSGGQILTLINNTGTGTTTGTFSGVANGTTITIDGKTFRVFYNGGTNSNDVLLINDPPVVTAFADDDWSALSDGALIQDADPVTAGDQSVIIGVTGFGTIEAALTKVGATGTVFVNNGTYAEAVTLSSQTLRMLGTNPSTAGTVTINSIAGAGTIDTSSVGPLANSLVVGDASSTTFSGVISGTGSLTKQGTGTLTLTGTNSYTTTTISAGTLQVGNGGTSGTLGSGAITNNANLTINRSDSVTLGVNITGTGSLTQAGSGTTILTGTNSYTTTTISAGTLQIGDNGTTGTLGSGTVTNDASLVFDRSDNLTVSNNITGSGSLTKLRSNTLILTGTNTFFGTTTITDGTLQIGDGGTSGTLGSGSVVNNATLNINRSNSVTLSNAISGTGAFNQNGTGTTVLTGTSNYTGATTINAGTLQVDGSISSNVTVQSEATLAGDGTTGAVTVNALGSLDPTPSLATSNLSIAGDLDVSISSASVFDSVIVTGTVNLDSTFALNLSGSPTPIAIGTVLTIIDNTGTDAVTTTGLVDGQTLTLASQTFKLFFNGGDGNDVVLVRFQSPSTIYVDDNWASLSVGTSITDADPVTAGAQPAVVGIDAFASIATALTEVTAGGEVLVNAGSYAEAVNIANGQTIRLLGSNPSTPATITINSLAGTATATLDTSSIGTLSNTLSLGDATNTTFAGAITGTGNLTKTGASTLTLTGTNTFFGTMTLSAGTLQIGDGGTSGTLGSGSVVNNATLNINRSNSVTLGNAISGTGAFNQNGTGTTVLTGTSTYSGATTINAGTLQVDGSISSAATVKSGATLSGTDTVGAVTVETGGTLDPIASLNTGVLTSDGPLNISISNASTFDSIITPGTVSLTSGFTANLSGTPVAIPLGTVMKIIDNTGTSPVSITGLVDGQTLTLASQTFRLFFNGGDGNDVVLVRANLPTTTFVDDAWTGFVNGQAITDLNPMVAGNQPGTFGIDGFASINAAIAGVATNGSVLVNAGTYAESVVVNKTITLDGNAASVANVVIDPTSGDGVSVTATGVTVRDLRITGAATALTAASVANITLRSLELANNTTAGLNLSNITTKATLADLVLTGNGSGGSLSSINEIDFTGSTGTFDDVFAVSGTSLQHTRGVVNQPLTLAMIATLNLFGDAGNDGFNVTPPPTGGTAISIDGGAGTDELDMNAIGLTTPNLIASHSMANAYTGQWTYGNAASVGFTRIENLDDVTLAITVPGGDVLPNTDFTASVTVTDLAGNALTGFTGPVTISKFSGPGTLTGTLTANAVGGVATFNNLRLSAEGSVQLQATIPGPNTATSSPITVLRRQLTFGTIPARVQPNQLFNLQVVARNGAGAVLTAFTGPVTLSLSGPGTLSGTLTVNAINGVATFTGLSINALGNYQLIANSSGFPARTAPVLVAPPRPAGRRR
jgi:autotransporter-associated beta strand protein